MKSLASHIAVVFSLSAFLFGIAARACETGHLTLTLNDPSRADRTTPVDVFDPTTTPGETVPVAPGEFPVVGFGHGFVIPEFLWPESASAFSGAIFRGGMTDPGLQGLIGEFDRIEFGWGK